MNRRANPFAPPPITPIQRGRPIPEIVATHETLDRYGQYLLDTMNNLIGPNGIINTGTQGAGTPIASAPTIVISDYLHIVTGTATITTISPPLGFSGATILVSQNGFSIGPGGNILIGAVALVPAPVYVQLVYHAALGLWHSTSLGSVPFGSGAISRGAIVVGNGSNAVLSLMLTDGQTIIGSTGALPQAASIGAGPGITTTPGPGTLSISNSGVLSDVAGPGISVSGPTGNVTIGNTGLLTVTGTANEITATAGQNPTVALATDITGPNSLTVASFAKVVPTLFAARPGTPTQGMIASFTDSTVNTFGATIAGSGANKVLAWYNGSVWSVIGA